MVLQHQTVMDHHQMHVTVLLPIFYVIDSGQTVKAKPFLNVRLKGKKKEINNHENYQTSSLVW